jgi:hypothetical protein
MKRGEKSLHVLPFLHARCAESVEERNKETETFCEFRKRNQKADLCVYLNAPLCDFPCILSFCCSLKRVR